MRSVVFATALVLVIACSSEGAVSGHLARDASTVDPASPTDSGTMAATPGMDAAPYVPSEDEVDAASPATDASVADARVEPADAARDAEAPDAAPPTDASADASDDDPELGAVQCQSDVDCPGALTCNQSAPGGICSGCGTDSDCPRDGSYTCNFAACVRDCNVDADCNAGMYCSGRGRCLIRTCPRGTDEECPGPYVCNTSFATPQCARPRCSEGVCPPPLTCFGAICVEP